jgi:hypothetical protein
MPTNSPQVPSFTLAAGLGGFVAAVVAAAVVGIVLAVSLLTGPADGHAAGHGSGRFTVAQDIETSFGWVAVEHAETVKGLTSKQLGGATHGIGSFVARDKALVQASVTLTNTTAGTVRYDPRQFVLVAKSPKSGKEQRIGATYASIKAGVLQPDAAIDAKVSFIVPRDGSRMSLAFTDPGRTAPVVIDLRQGAGRASAQELRDLADAHKAHGR